MSIDQKRLGAHGDDKSTLFESMNRCDEYLFLRDAGLNPIQYNEFVSSKQCGFYLYLNRAEGATLYVTRNVTRNWRQYSCL